MNKKIIALILSFSIGILSFQSCIGNFVLTRKLLNFNQRLSNKWVNEIVFLVMVIIPVYGVCILIDGIILNSIEFWTGSNPLAMEEGQVETKYITKGDIKYQIDISKNHYHFIQLEGPNKGEAADLYYNPETKTWSLGNGRTTKRVMQIVDENNVKIFNKNGESVVVSKNSDPENVMALVTKM
jgi:hypothetical protein